MRIQQLTEQPRRAAVIAFGRMNPPTIGHAKLVDAVKSQAGDPYIFLSQSQKPKTDPLSFEQKIGFAKAFFPGVTVGDPGVRTIFDALNKIYAMGYTDLVYVAGSDRIQQFTDLINKYNGQEDFYSFDSIQVVSAGERDPDAEGAEGMSASKMRAAAVAGDFEAFKSGTPKPELAQGMYDAVRTGMGMMESLARIIEVASRLRQLHEVKPLTENVKRAFGTVVEAWSEKYKRSINCDNPKGFSQRAHCAGRKKNEDINEALDSPYPITWEGDADSASAVAEIPLPNGDFDYLEVSFDREDQGFYEIVFTRNSRMKATGKGDEFRIFATVVEAIKQWWNKIDQDEVDEIYFNASKNPEDSARRHVLYSRFAKQFADRIGFDLKITDRNNNVGFKLSRKDVAEGKSPHKKGTKKYKAHMAAMHAGMNESYKLQLERDDDLLVLHILNTETKQRTEVRGKPNYEGDSYDSNDKLHQLLDKIGKAANMSELMNGEVVTINPRHPQGPSAKAHAEKAFNEDIAQDLEAEFPGLDLDLYDTKSGYILSKIVLPVGERNEGTGSKVMQRIVDMADQEGKLIALTPDTAFGGTQSRLIKFYKRFGFVPNKGRNKTFDFRETMVRYPKQTESISEAGVGRITKQNATKDAPIGSEFANVKKLGLGSGKPKELHAKARKNSDPNTLFNLGLVEGQLNEKGSIGIPLSSGMTVVIAPHRPLKVKKSKKKVKMVGAGEEE